MTLAQKFGSFDSDIKIKLKKISSEADSAHQAEGSIKEIRNRFGILCYRLMKNVSFECDRWVVETELCNLRDTSDTLFVRACVVFHL